VATDVRERLGDHVVGRSLDRRRQAALEAADGNGGARRVAGSGLDGLAQRVEALDGSLDVQSPDGGPTTIVARLPCAS